MISPLMKPTLVGRDTRHELDQPLKKLAYVSNHWGPLLIANQEVNAFAVTNDSQNILKVAGQRIPIAVIDSYVLQYLLEHDPYLTTARNKVKMNSKLLEEKQLFVAFSNDESGKKWKAIVDEGLKNIDSEAIMRQYFTK